MNPDERGKIERMFFLPYTRYNKTVLYTAYDVTDSETGENVVGVIWEWTI